MDDTARQSVIDSAEINPMAPGSHPECLSWSPSHSHWYPSECLHTLVLVLWDGTLAQPGCVQWPDKQSALCALSQWHSCLVGKKNRADKTNRTGFFSGSILLPLMFFLMCSILSWGRKQRLKKNPWKPWMQDSTCIRCEMVYWDHRDNGQEILSYRSQPHPQKKKTELPLFCIVLLQK